MEITIEQIENALDYVEYDHYGLPVIEIDDKEYAVGKPDEIHDAIVEYCRDNIQHFTPEFLSENSKFSTYLFKRLQDGEIFESEVYLELIDDLETFAENAQYADGAGHFLSPYDGEEIEICNENEEIEYYLYRIN